METATADPGTEPVDKQPEAKPFRWAEYVHAGEGATHCPDHGAACEDPTHFHAWLRLPNPFQRDDLREQAMAARARRLRQLRDDDSTTALVLEGELDDLRHRATVDGDTGDLIDRVLGQDWGRRHLRAMREVLEEEAFEHIEADRARYAELADLPEAQRPAEEYLELDKHIVAYGNRVEEVRVAAEAPLRASLADKTVEELLDIVREDQRSSLGNDAFFAAWVRGCLIAGSYHVEPNERRPTRPVFDGPAALLDATPEAADALRNAFVSLEAQFQDGLGN